MTKSRPGPIIISPASKRKLLESRIIKVAIDGRIACAQLRKIAEETGVSYKAAGELADKLKVKIRNCDLGCF